MHYCKPTDNHTVLIDSVPAQVTEDGILLDRVEIHLPDGQKLELMEAAENSGGGTFCDGRLIWYFDGGWPELSDWGRETPGVEIVNQDQDQEAKEVI